MGDCGLWHLGVLEQGRKDRIRNIGRLSLYKDMVLQITGQKLNILSFTVRDSTLAGSFLAHIDHSHRAVLN